MLVHVLFPMLLTISSKQVQPAQEKKVPKNNILRYWG